MTGVSKRDAQEIVLDLIAKGFQVREAMSRVGRSPETYREWRKKDPVFRERVLSLRAAIAVGAADSAAVPDYPEFAAKYLRKPLPAHQLRMWDAINGREPRDMHPAMQYQRGSGDGSYTILNVPPAHAKSTCWTVGYSVWRIHRNPDIRIVVVSKTQVMAQKFVNQIQFMLTSSTFAEMHAAFAPEGGWKPTERGAGLQWREDRFYVRGRTANEKDPTVQALGIGSQIYGSRADLIILDDIEDYANSGQFEKHAEWIAQDAFSRIEEGSDRPGELLIVGTRVAPVDIYSHLRDNALDEDDQPFYTYFSQPAILEGATAESKDWEVLWPERITPRILARKRAAFTDQRRFQLIYQQNDINDNNPFPAVAVDASVNQRRYSGPLVPGQVGHRPRGMEGLYTVAGLDPAGSGFSACVVMAVDPASPSGKRWVLDARNIKAASPQQVIDLIKEFQVKYRLNEWRIERNGIQRFITQLPEIRDFVLAHGGRIVEHQTRAASAFGKAYGKWDPDWGIESMIPLFLSCVETTGDGKPVPKPDGAGLIELPKSTQNPAVASLTEQLKLWQPNIGRTIPMDLVMALWFATIGIKERLQGGLFERTHIQQRFVSRRALASRGVVSVDDLMNQVQAVTGG